MKKIIFAFAASSVMVLTSFNIQKDKEVIKKNSSSKFSNIEWSIDALNHTAQDTSKTKSKSAHPKKTTAQKSTETKKVEHYKVEPGSGVSGEAGSGSGATNGGATNAADTMKIMK